jgi:hypothetical protein
VRCSNREAVAGSGVGRVVLDDRVMLGLVVMRSIARGAAKNGLRGYLGVEEERGFDAACQWIADMSAWREEMRQRFGG